MYQAEAMWVVFVGWYPCAIRVTADGVNAITGKRVYDERLWRPQDYVVIPQKPWMEWFCVGGERARQFFALPLDTGRTGDRPFPVPGGQKNIRITVHPMEGPVYAEYKKKRGNFTERGRERKITVPAVAGWRKGPVAGQEGVSGVTWPLVKGECCSVHTLNSQSYLSLLGKRPPGAPPSRNEYRAAGLPWFDYYGADARVLQ